MLLNTFIRVGFGLCRCNFIFGAYFVLFSLSLSLTLTTPIRLKPHPPFGSSYKSIVFRQKADNFCFFSNEFMHFVVCYNRSTDILWKEHYAHIIMKFTEMKAPKKCEGKLLYLIIGFFCKLNKPFDAIIVCRNIAEMHPDIVSVFWSSFGSYAKVHGVFHTWTHLSVLFRMNYLRMVCVLFETLLPFNELWFGRLVNDIYNISSYGGTTSISYNYICPGNVVVCVCFFHSPLLSSVSLIHHFHISPCVVNEYVCTLLLNIHYAHIDLFSLWAWFICICGGTRFMYVLQNIVSIW